MSAATRYGLDPATNRWDGTSWAARHPVLLAVLWPAVVVAVAAPLAVRRYRGLGR